MNIDLYLQLHDRYSRGEILSDSELTRLNSWYSQQDSDENTQINAAKTIITPANELQAQISITASQLQITSQHIAGTIATNEALRNEISALQDRLAQQISGRAA